MGRLQISKSVLQICNCNNFLQGNLSLINQKSVKIFTIWVSFYVYSFGKFQSFGKQEGKLMQYTSLLKSGWLTKRGGNVKNWKRRYFTMVRDSLNDAILTYYEDETLTSKKGEIEIANICSVQNRCPPFNSPIFEIQTTTRTYLLQADNPLEMESWTLAISLLANEKKNLRCEYGIVKQGILSKQGNVVKNWKTRLFTLYLQPLSQIIYADPHDQDVAKGFIDLSSIEDVIENVEENHSPEFEIVSSNNRSYVLRAETLDEMREWIDVIVTAVNSVTNRKDFKCKQRILKSNRRLSVKPSIIKQGWLLKRGESGFKLWSNRYFILQIVSQSLTSLKYFTGPDTSVPTGSIDMKEIKSIEREGENIFLYKSNRTYELQALSDIEAHEWEVKLRNSMRTSIS